MPYNTSISRDVSNDPLVPEPVAAEIISNMPASSAVLSRARHVTMSSKTFRQPVLSVLPQAYWVDGDTGLKQTGTADFENCVLTAEELAVIIPIPEAYLDDAQVPIWDAVRPSIAEAFGRKIDQAALFGTDAPASWSDSIVVGAAGAGNIVLEGSTDDLASDVAATAELVAEDGYGVDGFVTAPGFRWKLIGQRTSGDGAPIYAPPAGDQPGTLFGYPLGESLNGGFDTDIASLIGGDWTKAVVGIRQDITFKMFTEGAITDGDGKVILNLMQQDSVALRAVMRVGFCVANPANRVEETKANRYPFGALVPPTSQYS